MRQKRFKRLQTACAEIVKNRLRGDLETVARNHLGRRSDRGDWFRYEIDPQTDSPVLWFDYESTLPAAGGYIVPAVKLEFGSLTDQRPVGRHTITPMLAKALPDLEEERDEVVAMEVERTFWEKRRFASTSSILKANHGEDQKIFWAPSALPVLVG